MSSVIIRLVCIFHFGCRSLIIWLGSAPAKEVPLKILKLPKGKLDLFASVDQQFGELHAPVEQDGKYVFKRLVRWPDARLEYRSEEHTSELQSLRHLGCRLLLEKKRGGWASPLSRSARGCSFCSSPPAGAR